MRAVLALGSNLGRRFETLQSAVDALFDAPGLDYVGVSPVYETEPVGGPESQRSYLNAVLLADSGVDAYTLLERTQSVESAFGRVRRERWGPRTLDVDLIAVGDLRCDSPELTLPHPLAHERAFVLAPWARVDPDAVLPGHGPVSELLAGLDQRGIRLRQDLKLQGPA